MSIRKVLLLFVCLITVLSCSVNKFIPEGECLLDDVDIVCSTNGANAAKAKSYMRIQPNSKWFSLVKLPMYTYALSGTDDSKWINRALKRIGEAPVIYDDGLAEATRVNIEQMLRNDGYLHATVDLECEKDVDSKRAKATYYLHERERYYISEISLNTKDKRLAGILVADSALSSLKVGMPFSVDGLEYERRRITEMLRNNGYYRFQKDYIAFTADTVHHSDKVRLTMDIALFTPEADAQPIEHRQYHIDNVNFVSGAGLHLDDAALSLCDTMSFGGNRIYYKDNPVVRPKVLANNTYVEHGKLYSLSDVERTHNSFVQLPALKYTTVRMREHADTSLLDCYIMYERSKRSSVSLDVEGTNTAGDLGAAASLTFSDNNLFQGSELLSLRVFGAYEAVSNLHGYTGEMFLEYGAELGLRFRGGVISRFVPADKRMLVSSTMFTLKLDAQDRPEFYRRVLSGTWSYQWSRNEWSNHKVDMIDLNYIYVPWISGTFKKEYLDSISNRNSILKYNYENLLITKLGYTYTYNSSLKKSNQSNPYAYSYRVHLECSGNALYGMNKLFGGSKNSDGQYVVSDLAYAQYVKGDFDFTARYKFNGRNTIVMHWGMGVAYPYGNSTILPFEKRYFAGGANGMRGWSVRTLGPGRYRNEDRKIDFINQSGEVKLDINLEFRSRLFWKLHSAVFVDAGNIWSLREYKEQPGGKFDISTFYRDIAFSVGAGLRLELDMFVFRLDGAFKAVNPAYEGKEKYPLFDLDFGRDFALHFAIGYPF
jgi:outer membrane protein assembly factor BamA